MQRHSIRIEGGYTFEVGQTINPFEIVFHTSPHKYHKGEKVIWICHALTANSDPEDWWPQLVGPGKLFDTDRYFVVCSNSPGSPYGTTGPASINPATGKHYMLDFPKVTVRDIVGTNILVRKHLDIDQIDLMIGASIGGFQAIEWSIIEPDVIKNAAFIATAPMISPYITAYEEAQRMALEADHTFLEAKSLDGGTAGLRCARAIALISYRSFDGYNDTQSETDPEFMFASRASSYQRYQGKKLSDRFDAYSYWYLSYSLDSMNIGRGRGGKEKALSLIEADCTVISIDSDCVFPAKDLENMTHYLKKSTYHTMTSRFGHDGFLLEDKQLTAIIKPLLQ